MASTVESAQIVPVKLDNSNYVHWASLMHNFLKGRNLWKYVMGNCKMPIATLDVSSTKAIEEWEINNSRDITLLASVVSPSISLQVEKRFVGTNFAQKYKLEMDIRSLRQGPSQSNSNFYVQMSLLWDQLAVMDPKFEYDKDTLIFQSYIDEVKLIQFLMALCEDYEFVCSTMFHRSPLPSVETALSKLLSEETRRLIGGPLGSSISDTEIVFTATPRKSFSSSVPKSRQSHDMSRVQCNYCKVFGHMKFTCPKIASDHYCSSSYCRFCLSCCHFM
ncbi:hypothetical protein H6P81_020085 [Aristolochia fimbriata]|uniref:Retrotransposon Copia-like N-terminal domain-containing protein n=1 Tax=Aristolochia fimbriata TaxID=158543 RepID=A0AAV7DTJ0_ARIFI|nr:hypothetical protein H6P81_020085 [Aristolochia fimbriata]